MIKTLPGTVNEEGKYRPHCAACGEAEGAMRRAQEYIDMAKGIIMRQKRKIFQVHPELKENAD